MQRGGVEDDKEEYIERTDGVGVLNREKSRFQVDVYASHLTLGVYGKGTSFEGSYVEVEL